MRLVVLGLLMSFTASAVVVNGFSVSLGNAKWAERSTERFPEYWSLVPDCFHAEYGMNVKTWMAKDSYTPFPWNIKWEVRRDARLAAAQDDLKDAVEEHEEGDFKSAQRQYNRFLENMFKATVYDSRIPCPAKYNYQQNHKQNHKQRYGCH